VIGLIVTITQLFLKKKYYLKCDLF